jgi:hypothetical protein
MGRRRQGIGLRARPTAVLQLPHARRAQLRAALLQRKFACRRRQPPTQPPTVATTAAAGSPPARAAKTVVAGCLREGVPPGRSRRASPTVAGGPGPWVRVDGGSAARARP